MTASSIISLICPVYLGRNDRVGVNKVVTILVEILAGRVGRLEVASIKN